MRTLKQPVADRAIQYNMCDLADDIDALTPTETIRYIFDRYLELESVRNLAEEIKRSGMVMRRGRPRNGKSHITEPYRRGHLYHLLGNPIYAGKIRHRDKVYEGQHDGIVDPGIFERVQLLLKDRAPKRRHPTNTADVHLLTGILFDETGDRLTPTHASKRGVRYRYYVSKRIIERGRNAHDSYAGWRIAAGHLDTLVETQLLQILRNGNQLTAWFGDELGDDTVAVLATQALAQCKAWSDKTAEQKRSDIQSFFAKIVVRPGRIRFEIDRKAFFAWLMDLPPGQGADATPAIIAVERPMSVRRRGVENRMVLANGASMPQPDASLIDLIVRANRYLADLTDGSPKSLSQVARDVGTNISEVSRLLPFAFLAPSIVEAILAGNQPLGLGALRLGRLADLPLDWERQAELLGF